MHEKTFMIQNISSQYGFTDANQQIKRSQAQILGLKGKKLEEISQTGICKGKTEEGQAESTYVVTKEKNGAVKLS